MPKLCEGGNRETLTYIASNESWQLKLAYSTSYSPQLLEKLPFPWQKVAHEFASALQQLPSNFNLLLHES